MENQTNLFDIVIPVGPNDLKQIKLQLEYTKKNIIGYRNIFIITAIPNIKLDGVEIIDDNIFPFNLNNVAEYHPKNSRNGWYLQQLLKLYAGFVIPNILDKYLVVDADTIFLKPTKFIENNKSTYCYGSEYNYPYFEHMSNLHETFNKVSNKSGICHHMMFETKYVKEIIDLVETKHNKEFWKIFLIFSATNYKLSGASEYEIYFNYMLMYHPDSIIIRDLNWKNVDSLEDLKNNKNNFDYISYHWYNRK